MEAQIKVPDQVVARILAQWHYTHMHYAAQA